MNAPPAAAPDNVAPAFMPNAPRIFSVRAARPRGAGPTVTAMVAPSLVGARDSCAGRVEDLEADADLVRRYGERGAEADRLRTRRQDEHAARERLLHDPVRRGRRAELERRHEALAADIGHEPAMLRGELAQAIEQVRALARRVRGEAALHQIERRERRGARHRVPTEG